MMAKFLEAPQAAGCGPIEHALDLDASAECERIASFMRQTLVSWHKRGMVVAVSGGIDSAVCAALAVQAVGRQRVLALLLPERECPGQAKALGLQVVQSLGIDHRVQDIGAAMEALGGYQERDSAVAELVPGYGPGWTCKLAIAPLQALGFSVFNLVVRSPEGQEQVLRLPPNAYLRIVAATNHKQRLRKAVEYFHADRCNYAVVGTANLAEAELGFFVKGGDGAADLKPIAHLYKSQVYRLAQHLNVPLEVQQAQPTTGTYSLEQGQDEFFFGLPPGKLDLALWSLLRGGSPQALAGALEITPSQADDLLTRLASQRRAAAYLSAPAARL